MYVAIVAGVPAVCRTRTREREEAVLWNSQHMGKKQLDPDAVDPSITFLLFALRCCPWKYVGDPGDVHRYTYIPYYPFFFFHYSSINSRIRAVGVAHNQLLLRNSLRQLWLRHVSTPPRLLLVVLGTLRCCHIGNCKHVARAGLLPTPPPPASPTTPPTTALGRCNLYRIRYFQGASKPMLAPIY